MRTLVPLCKKPFTYGRYGPRFVNGRFTSYKAWLLVKVEFMTWRSPITGFLGNRILMHFEGIRFVAIILSRYHQLVVGRGANIRICIQYTELLWSQQVLFTTPVKRFLAILPAPPWMGSRTKDQLQCHCDVGISKVAGGPVLLRFCGDILGAIHVLVWNCRVNSSYWT